MNNNEILEIVRNYLTSQLSRLSDRKFADTDSLFQDKVLGSEEFIELTIFLEEEFGVQIPGRVYGLSEFDTIVSIADFVEGML